MVKGNSRQVIVVQNPEQKLFEQAIFILKEDVLKDGVTDDELMQEARRAAGEGKSSVGKRNFRGPLWACGGAVAMGLLWLLTMVS